MPDRIVIGSEENDDRKIELGLRGTKATLPVELTDADGNQIVSRLITENYDSFDVTYVSGGNGDGEIETIIYKLSSVAVATLTLAYNSDDKLLSLTKS